MVGAGFPSLSFRGTGKATAVASPAKQKIVRLYVPEKGKKTQMIAGSPREAAKELVKRLREEARVLS